MPLVDIQRLVHGCVPGNVVTSFREDCRTTGITCFCIKPLISQNGQTHFKNPAVNAARFLKCLWPIWNTMHWRVKRKTCSISANNDTRHINFLVLIATLEKFPLKRGYKMFFTLKMYFHYKKLVIAW